MLYIAFTLGFFGSLHCLGMCGPLAIAFSNKTGNSTIENLLSGLQYNFGRIFTYSLLGVFFGLIGSFIFLADLQKYFSIFVGITLVISFLFSINIDHKLQKLPFFSTAYNKVQSTLTSLLSKSRTLNPFILGIANGLLPCGLVYLALAGSMSTGNIVSGFSFMFAFGLGTIPMLLSLTMSSHLILPKWRSKIRNIIPWVSLSFGVFLIYRGLAIDIPAELNFWEALRNPIMCH